jgi:hypothetical protein
MGLQYHAQIWYTYNFIVGLSLAFKYGQKTCRHTHWFLLCSSIEFWQISVFQSLHSYKRYRQTSSCSCIPCEMDTIVLCSQWVECAPCSPTRPVHRQSWFLHLAERPDNNICSDMLLGTSFIRMGVLQEGHFWQKSAPLLFFLYMRHNKDVRTSEPWDSSSERYYVHKFEESISNILALTFTIIQIHMLNTINTTFIASKRRITQQYSIECHRMLLKLTTHHKANMCVSVSNYAVPITPIFVHG